MAFGSVDEVAPARSRTAHAGVASGEGHVADVDPVDTHPDAMIDVGDALQGHFDFGLRRRRRDHVRQVDDLTGRLARHDQRTEEILLVAVHQRTEEDRARLHIRRCWGRMTARRHRLSGRRPPECAGRWSRRTRSNRCESRCTACPRRSRKTPPSRADRTGRPPRRSRAAAVRRHRQTVAARTDRQRTGSPAATRSGCVTRYQPA